MTCGDLAAAWRTIQAIGLYQPEVADRICFLIVDNEPDRAGAGDVEALEATLRYVPFTGPGGAAPRDLVFREANADIVCCIDSHVLVQAGALAAILAWFDEHPGSRDLIQGPLLHDDLDGIAATHLDPVWVDGSYGRSGLDERIARPAATPFEIGMQHLGLFACRREAWPGLNPRFRGFGGQEGYLHEKFRRAGGRVLCHPALRWTHRPQQARCPSSWQDTVRNYRIGWEELGWDGAVIDSHYAQRLRSTPHDSARNRILEDSFRQASNPFAFFDAIFCLNLDSQPDRWREATGRHAQLGMAWQVERFPAVATPENPHRGIAMSFRQMIVEATRRAYKHLLVLEDDALFLDDTIMLLRSVTAELADHEWNLCYLGACVWSQVFPFLANSTVLQSCGPVTCTHAIAVHRSAYPRLLAEIPTAPRELDRWLREDHAIDQYLSRRIADGTYRAVITSPRVASQPNLLDDGDGDGALAARYVI
ncbi:MAG: hypothetical protein QOJ63_2193 [Solirubrobacteraceae bacterium]|nr:hypothetical protein [Solirubrobacteraceae bacterium]